MNDGELLFYKYEGTRNDFIVIDAEDVSGLDWASLASRICDRRGGIGADGVLLVSQDTQDLFRMTVINADGSEAGMCGNGLRCVVRYLVDQQRWPWQPNEQGPIMTRDGLRHAVLTNGGDITLDMGQPKLACQDIPAIGPLDTRIAEYPLVIGDQTWAITALSMGNPHAVVWVDALDSTPVDQWGPLLSCHPMFPDRANVEFVQRVSPHAVRARVWERGVGETMACGTGACAIVVAGVLNECLKRTVTVTLPGGTLLVTWQDNHHVYLTGNARFVFKGRFQLLN